MKNFKLDNHPKIKSGFTIPENYFDDVESGIASRLESGKSKVIPFFTRKKVWIPAAAAILILALMLPFYTIKTSETEPDVASIENYLTYNSDISQYELVSLMDTDDVNTIDAEIQIDDQVIEDVLTTNNNFENYLID